MFVNFKQYSNTIITISLYLFQNSFEIPSQDPSPSPSWSAQAWANNLPYYPSKSPEYLQPHYYVSPPHQPATNYFQSPSFQTSPVADSNISAVTEKYSGDTIMRRAIASSYAAVQYRQQSLHQTGPDQITGLNISVELQQMKRT